MKLFTVFYLYLTHGIWQTSYERVDADTLANAVRAALDQLKQFTGTDPDHVYLLGATEGDIRMPDWDQALIQFAVQNPANRELVELKSALDLSEASKVAAETKLAVSIKALENIYNGAAPKGRWIDANPQDDSVDGDAQWLPYNEDEQTSWLSNIAALAADTLTAFGVALDPVDSEDDKTHVIDAMPALVEA